jgi:ribosomal-protein-alanine N-acetyltransferase
VIGFTILPCLKKNGELIGFVALMEVVRGVSYTCFLGYRIFSPHWGQGYAKEAIRAVIDIGFKDLKLHRIEAGVEPSNIRSIRTARSLKMRKEGLKKRALFLRGKWVDLVIYTITTEDAGYKFRGSPHKLN